MIRHRVFPIDPGQTAQAEMHMRHFLIIADVGVIRGSPGNGAEQWGVITFQFRLRDR